MKPTSLLKVVKGNVICYKCLFSFKLLTKSIELNTIAIIVEKDNAIKLKQCEIIGHKSYATSGIVVQRANLIIENSIIYNFLSGGISLYLSKKDTFECLNTVIVRNEKYGIDIMGEEGRVFLSNNKILFNNKQGVRIGISVNAFLIRNEISHN